MAYQNIIVETRARSAWLPQPAAGAQRALAELMRDLASALDAFEGDDNIGCMVVTAATRLLPRRRHQGDERKVLHGRFQGRLHHR